LVVNNKAGSSSKYQYVNITKWGNDISF
jgi:hypothetical protein